ncbi:MAG: type II toxin-antitoxin system prevent-host-death family antitoxin [Phenylobacterium sp.]|nr:type II toxin-antitoxin system prevent-host-death family antitoxin [Phenylobacterium sp.]
MTNVRVSSAEFLKGYGRISETALREPVSITSHGRDRLVLLSAEEYRRLKANDREALYPWELSPDDLRALEVAEPPTEATAFDHELKSE